MNKLYKIGARSAKWGRPSNPAALQKRLHPIRLGLLLSPSGLDVKKDYRGIELGWGRGGEREVSAADRV